MERRVCLLEKAQKSNPTLPSGSPHPTIATIAAHMGLSRATVTHVLNGKAAELRIRPETQRRVLDAAHELGYRANASARAIREGRFGNIALIQSTCGQYLPDELLNGMTRAIADKDLHLTLTHVRGNTLEDESYLPHAMRDLSADGVLINRHTGSTLPYLERIHRLRVPAIFVNVRQEYDCVHPDDLLGGRMAAEFLLGLGHERIAYVDTDDPGNRHYSKLDRRLGYEETMTSAGRNPRVWLLPKEWQADGESGRDERVESALQLLAGDDRPTAVIAYELAEAMAVVRAAYVLQLRIPNELSLIEFHHNIDDRLFIPIQTVSNAMEKVGISAVDMLLEKIRHPDVPLPERSIAVTMLDGATCMRNRE